jgi:hypothetical protein
MEDCPSAEELEEEVRKLSGELVLSSQSNCRVHFHRQDGLMEATIQVGEAHRSLAVHGSSCEPLAGATAVTLAMLLNRELATADRPRTTETRQAPPSLAVAPQRDPSPTGLGLSASAIGVLGVLGSFTPGLTLEAYGSRSRLHLALGAAWLMPRTFSVGPGAVTESMALGTVRACVGFARAGSVDFSACGGAQAGFLSAKARGFTESFSARRPWVSLPFELGVGAKHWQVAVGVWVNIKRADLEVQNESIVYASWPVSAQLALRTHFVLL